MRTSHAVHPTPTTALVGAIGFALIILFLAPATEASTPVRHRIIELFDADFAPTPEQQNVISRLEQIQLDRLVVDKLLLSEVLRTLQVRLVAAGVSDIHLAWDASIDLPRSFISYTGREMSLANALFYLRGGTHRNIHYKLRGSEILAVRLERVSGSVSK